MQKMQTNNTHQQSYNSINNTDPVTLQYVVMEPSNCRSCCSRCMFILVNLIIFLISLGLVSLGGFGIYYFDSIFLISRDDGLYIPIIFVVVGSFLGCLSLFACCMNPKRNFWGAYIYSFFHFICFMCVIIGIVIFFSKETAIENSFKNGFDKAVKNYTAYQKQIDNFQTTLHCCGSNNYTDYFGNYMPGTYQVPKSCCAVDTSFCKTTFDYPNEINYDIYQKGCSAEIVDFIQDNYLILSLIGISFSFIPLFAAILACCMIHNARNANVRIGYQRF